MKTKEPPKLPKYENHIKRLKAISKILKTTSESRPLTFTDINEKLPQELKCDRRTFYAALGTLKEHCLMKIERKYFMRSVGEGKRQRMYGYYCILPSLDFGEARFLLDAVQSAAFITGDQTETLCQDIMTLANMQDLAPVWKKTVIPFNYIKHGNNSVIESIAEIDRALEENLQIKIKWHYINLLGEEIDRGEKCVNPLGLIFNSGYYYLCCCYDEKNVYSYRLDRITDIIVLDETPISVSQKFIDEFRNGERKNRLIAFNMWGGKLEKVTMRFPNAYAEEIMDRFGTTAEYRQHSVTHFDVTAGVFISPVFLGWCAGYGDKLEIIEPTKVRIELAKLWLQMKRNLSQDDIKQAEEDLNKSKD